VLGSWDYQNSAEAQAATLFEHFWWHLLLETFKDDLPEAYWPEGGSRWYEVMHLLVENQHSSWWDDKASEEFVETREDIFARAFELAYEQMKKEYSKDASRWPAWRNVHTATFRNQTLGKSGIGPIEDIFNRGPFATGGNEEAVNATGWNVGESFEVQWLPSERVIIDLSDLENSLAIHTTGQSGHAFHPHYDDMAPLWAAVAYFPMLWDQQVIVDHAEGHLRLLP